MGQLFVIEGEEHKPGRNYDLGMFAHSQIIEYAIKVGENVFPLTRRFSDFYLDAYFAFDEIQYLVQELGEIEKCVSAQEIRAIIELCSFAMSINKGVSVIAD